MVFQFTGQQDDTTHLAPCLSWAAHIALFTFTHLLKGEECDVKSVRTSDPIGMGHNERGKALS